jgi:hypothetical protein
MDHGVKNIQDIYHQFGSGLTNDFNQSHCLFSCFTPKSMFKYVSSPTQYIIEHN